jgi:hypothetical protein
MLAIELGEKLSSISRSIILRSGVENIGHAVASSMGKSKGTPDNPALRAFVTPAAKRLHCFSQRFVDVLSVSLLALFHRNDISLILPEHDAGGGGVRKSRFERNGLD